MSRLTILVTLAALACTAGSDDETGTTDTGSNDTAEDTGTEGTGQTHAIVTTVASDYSTGSVAIVDLDDWTVTDSLFVTSGDPAVSADDGHVFQINRLGYDTIRSFEPGSWTEPSWEKELADNSNPGQAAVCDGTLFVTLYGTATVGAYDPATGNLTGTVDLSAYNDGDSVGPEPGSMVELDGKLYVGLERLDRDNSWVDTGGKVVEIDCATKAATRAWDVGGNTSVHAWPDSGKVLVTARAFGDDAGGLYALDPTADAMTHLLDITGESLSGVAAHGTKAIATSLAADYSHYAIHCIDLDAKTATTTTTAEYTSSVAGNDRGEAWVTLSPSWLDSEAPVGVRVYDIATCTEQTTTPLATALGPNSIAFF